MDETSVKAEMRIFALESIICQHLATHYLPMPREIFDATRKLAVEGAMRQTFSGGNPAESDLLSAELQVALERLYGMIKYNLETVRIHQLK
ncbi:MAG: hypothetical protein WAM55_04215 [Methylovirgula sp.]